MKNWNGFDKLEVEVTRINEGIELTQTLLVDTYLIDAEIDKYGEEMVQFKGFYDIEVKGLKYFKDGSHRSHVTNAKITWNEDVIEVILHEEKNARITLYFTIINEFDEEVKIDMTIDTSFDY